MDKSLSRNMYKISEHFPYLVQLSATTRPINSPRDSFKLGQKLDF